MILQGCRYNTIEIRNSGVIDGKGAVIDMAGSTIRAVFVYDSSVTIKNLTIKNANCASGAGAVYIFGGTVVNCSFTNN